MKISSRSAIIGGGALLLLAAAFGVFQGKTAPPEGNDALSKAVHGKSKECGLDDSTSGECHEGAAPEVVCGCRCLANSTCDQIRSSDNEGPFLKCLAACTPAK